MHQLKQDHFFSKNSVLDAFFGIRSYPMAGGIEVTNNQESRLLGSPFHIYSGASTRRIIDFKEPHLSWGINPAGQSGHFLDAHYRDQAPLYVKGSYRRQLLLRKDIVRKKVKRLLLQKKKDSMG